MSDQFEEALKCSTKEEAEAWLSAEVQLFVESPDSSVDDPVEAERIIKENLGYFAGYYGDKEAEHIFEMFGVVHPIFGTATYNKDVTPAEAFQAGVDWMKDRIKEKLDESGD
jgi:hypothetical protein